MKLFLDANLLVCVLNKEYPQFPFCARVLSLAGQGGFILCTTPICLAIAFYFSEKKSGQVAAKQKLAVLLTKIQVCTADLKIVSQAVASKQVTDLEDGIEYFAAKAAGCSAIISEDVGDFYFSDIPVHTAEEFLTSLG
ncbi:MAG: type II toxin-antitoxin system VapC family toxin [Cyclobacteriaceae bacterium]